MFDTKAIEDLVKRVSESIPPGLSKFKEDLERNLRSGLQSTFNKLDLITREEFDVQAGVLAKTRKKLEALEKEVSKLEALISGKKSKKAEK